MDIEPDQSKNETLSALQRYFNGEAQPEDWPLIQQFKSTGRINISTGNRSVAIQGNVIGSTINTGDTYNIFSETPSIDDHQGQSFSRTEKVMYQHEIKNRGLVIADLSRKEFTQTREAFREGRRQEVDQWVQNIQIDLQRWDALQPDLQAEIIRFDALIHIFEPGGTIRAKLLAEKAEKLFTNSGSVRLRAWIAYQENEIDKACELLNGDDDVDSINLRAALLLEAGKLSESIKVLDFVTHPFTPNAESYRLRAFTQLFIRNITQAQLEIQTAASIAPKWENIAYSTAVIDFYSSVSPAGLPDQFLPWPEPIEPALFLSDEESIVRLENAENIFKTLSVSHEKRPEEIVTYKIWLAATLFGHPQKRQEAIAQFKNIVNENLTEYRAISWLALSGDSFDLRKVRNALKKYINTKEKSLIHLSTLISIQLNLMNFKQARFLLNNFKAVFIKAGAEILYESRNIALWMAQGNDEKALEEIGNSNNKNELGIIEAVVLGHLARKTKNFKEYHQFLQARYEETQNPTYLLFLCRSFYEHQDWESLESLSDITINTIRTAEIVHLAVAAAYNLKHYDRCLQILDGNRKLFFNGQLPDNIRRVRIECLNALGAIPRAYAEAESLVQDAPTTENLLILAQENFRKADLKGLTLVGSRLIQQPDISAEECIRLAYWIRLVNLDLARSFWKRAESIGISDSLLASALNVSRLIGLDAETDHLILRLQGIANAKEYGITSFDISTLQAYIGEQQELILDRNRVYQQGIVPIHAFANAVNITLADLYHFIPETNGAKPDPLRQPSIMIRNAGKKILPAFELPFPVRRLHLDLTSLLLATHLEILGKIEQAFSPIFIPADTVTALLAMIDAVNNQQLTQIQIAQDITDHVRRGDIKVVSTNQDLHSDTDLINEMGMDWVTLYEDARKNKGYLLDYYPIQAHIHGEVPEHLPVDNDQIVVSCGSLLMSLYEKGPLSEEMYQAVHSKLYDQAITSNQIESLVQGSPIYCWGNILDYFARINLLPILCVRFQVFISDHENQTILQQLDGVTHKQRTELFLEQLLEHVRSGLENGTYRNIEISPSIKKTSQEIDETNPILSSVRSLFLFKEQEGDIISIDDRYITSFAYRDSAPILGIDEILRYLVWKKIIAKSEYYHLVSSMRAGNFRYIPLMKDELLFHLRNARVVNGEVVETLQLSIVRQYIAACLSDGRFLQRPIDGKITSDTLGEVEFIRGLSDEVTNAIIELWDDDRLEEPVVTAYSDWILTNIYLDNAGLMHAVNLTRSEKDDVFRLAISIVSFLFQGFHFTHLNEDQQNLKRKRYFTWLESRLLNSLFIANPSLTTSVTDMMKFYIGQSDRNLFRGKRALKNLLYQEYILDLPSPLFKRLEIDQKFMNDLGFRTVIHFGDVAFDLKEFHQGITNLVNNRLAIVHNLETEQEILLHKSGEDSNKAFFIHPINGTQIQISLIIVPLLSNSPRVRQLFLQDNKEIFDLPDGLFEKAIAKIVVTSNAQKRIDDFLNWENSNIDHYYSRVRNSIIKEHSFNFIDGLPPNGERLIHHYRLWSEAEKADVELLDIGKAVEVLLTEVGLRATVLRLVNLPIPLHHSILIALAQIPIEECEELLKFISARSPSPIARLHILHLANQFSFTSEEVGTKRLLENLLSETVREEFKAFSAILSWTVEEIENWSELRMTPAAIRLTMVWAHASRLYSVFRSAGTPMGYVIDTFKGETNNHISTIIFNRQLGAWYDVAHPRRISFASYLISGISYGLGAKTLNNVSDGLQDQFIQFLKSEVEKEKEALLFFLRDDAQSPNILGSFLSSKQIGDSLDEITESTNKWVLQTLNQVLQGDGLAENLDVKSNWLEFYALVGDFPQNEIVTNHIILAIRNAKFSQLIGPGDLALSIQSLYAASLQLAHINDDEARAHIKTELIELSRLLGEEVKQNPLLLQNDESKKNNEFLFGLLIEITLNLTNSVSSTPNEVRNFSNTISEIVDLCPTTAFDVKRAIWRLYHDLPIDQGQEMLALLLKLRSKE